MNRCYLQNNNFIIEVDLCSTYKDLVVKQTFDENSKEDVFKISGERVIKEASPDAEIVFDFINKRETYKNFKFEIRIKKSNYDIANIGKEWKERMENGVLILEFNVKQKRKKKN